MGRFINRNLEKALRSVHSHWMLESATDAESECKKRFMHTKGLLLHKTPPALELWRMCQSALNLPFYAFLEIGFPPILFYLNWT